MKSEPLDEYEPLVARIRQSRPFYDLLAKHLGRAKLAGIRPAWNKDSAATGDPAGGNWFVFSGFLQGLAPKMFEIGLPIAYGPERAPVTLLSGDNVNAFVVNPAKNIWRCFTGCDAGGDVVELARRLGDGSYKHAASYLATLAGGATPKRSSVPVSAVTTMLRSMVVCTMPHKGTTRPSHASGTASSEVHMPLRQ